MRMKPCPFCGQKVKAEYPYLCYMAGLDTWTLDHCCGNYLDLKVCINIYGKTKEEVIERWNGRAENGKKHSAN